MHDALVHISLGCPHIVPHIVHTEGLPIRLQALLSRETPFAHSPLEICLKVLGQGRLQVSHWILDLYTLAVPMLGRLAGSATKRMPKLRNSQIPLLFLRFHYSFSLVTRI
jgi:hypothetical protein